MGDFHRVRNRRHVFQVHRYGQSAPRMAIFVKVGAQLDSVKCRVFRRRVPPGDFREAAHLLQHLHESDFGRHTVLLPQVMCQHPKGSDPVTPGRARAVGHQPLQPWVAEWSLRVHTRPAIARRCGWPSTQSRSTSHQWGRATLKCARIQPRHVAKTTNPWHGFR